MLSVTCREGVVESRSRSGYYHREMEGGTLSSASSICHEEVEHVHTVMDRGVVNTVPSQDPVDKFRSYLLHGNKVLFQTVSGPLSFQYDLLSGDAQSVVLVIQATQSGKSVPPCRTGCDRTGCRYYTVTSTIRYQGECGQDVRGG